MKALVVVAYLITCGAQPVPLAEFNNRRDCDWFAFTEMNKHSGSPSRVECYLKQEGLK